MSSAHCQMCFDFSFSVSLLSYMNYARFNLRAISHFVRRVVHAFFLSVCIISKRQILFYIFFSVIKFCCDLCFFLSTYSNE